MSHSERDIVIEPGRGVIQYWRDLWAYRELFVFLAWRDITVCKDPSLQDKANWFLIIRPERSLLECEDVERLGYCYNGAGR